MSAEEDLKEWIKREITISEEDVLSLHKARLAKILGVTREGKVLFRIDKNQLDAVAQIGACLLGRLLAKLAGYTDEDFVTNKELEDWLKMPSGTVRGRLTGMREEGMAESVGPGRHRIPANSIPSLLDYVEKQLNGSGNSGGE